MLIDRRFLIIALMLAGSAVALGAFGTHGLAKILSEAQLQTFNTAVRYQMYHGLALLMISVCGQAFKQSMWKVGQWLLVVGTIVFSLSLYLYLAFSIKALAMITPLGGSAMILGWLWLIVAVWKKEQ